MRRDEDAIVFDGEVVHTTDKAVLFRITELDEEIWFPLSQCDLSRDETSITIPVWLARAKGLDE